jgi:hypothetical protein
MSERVDTMFLTKLSMGLTIAIVSARLGSGPLDVDILMEGYWPIQAPSFIKIRTISVCGSVETPQDWFNLAVALQNQRHRLDKEETLFIANVINRLTVSEDAMPTPDHAEWLCNLKRRFGL